MVDDGALPLSPPPRPLPPPTPPPQHLTNSSLTSIHSHTNVMECCKSYRCCYSGESRMDVCPWCRPVFCETNMAAVYDEITLHFSFIFLFFLSFEGEVRGGKVFFSSSMSILCGSIPEENTWRWSPARDVPREFNRCLNVLDSILHLASGESSYLICPFFFSVSVKKSASFRLGVSFFAPPWWTVFVCMIGFGCKTLMLHAGLLNKWSLQSFPAPGDEVACCRDMLMAYAGSHKEPEGEIRAERGGEQTGEIK